LALVPVGVLGELHIAGAGLARGYAGRPGLTAERFVACPYGTAGERMYRTGDVVRWNVNGELEFVGRTDDQVKIRGFRIELTEIESALARHDGVAESLVAIQQSEDGRRRIVAYVVPASVAPVPAALRVFLAESLPDYMIPSAFVMLDELPLSTNGKVDRAALPQPGTGSDSGYLAPTGSTETALVDIWADVLGRDRVGVRDNFFDLGGDSILSIQMVSRARQAGLRVSTKDLFRHQTIEELAPVVSTVDAGDAGLTVVDEAPLTPIQHWFFQNHTVNPRHFNQSLLVELTPDLDEAALRCALDALVAHHDALRMRFDNPGGEWRQYNAPVRPDSILTGHDLSDVDETGHTAAMEKVADDVHTSFELGRGRLLKGTLFRLGDGRCPYLFLAAHHLVVDGVSWRIILDDLDTAYRQATGGTPVNLGGRTTSFLDWACRLSEYVTAGGLDHELEHWTTALEKGEPSAAVAGPTGSVPVTLDADDTEALLRRAPTAYRTRINDVLLAALAWALSRWTGQTRVYVDLEGHGREELLDGVDLSHTVGWFTTIFPVQLDVSAGSTLDWRGLVKSVRRQLRTVPGNGFGFGALRYLGTPDVRRRLSDGRRGPQIVFNYLGQWDARPPDAAIGLYRDVHTSLGQDHDPAQPGVHPMEVVGAVQDGRLRFSWYYQPQRIDRSTVESIAANFADALRRIARDCGELTS
jgi:non-ribosomal peptide synthase protein (TIGR01720 family)